MQRRFGLSRGLIVGWLAAAIVGAACGGSGSSSSAVTGGTKQQLGVATWSEAPATPPNYIFPFMSLAYFSVANTEQFQYLMYRPLYWFGVGTQPTLNTQLSMADPPTYSNGDTVAVINLKPYRWSNGEAVNAQDVMFWMNMMHSEKANWAAYASGTIPDNLKGVTINSPTQLTFTLSGPFNQQFFTYNQLSQITPLPVAWDAASVGGAPGSGGCSGAVYGAADTQCAAVYTFLSQQAGFDPSNPKAANNSLPTYATNPIWQIVDGPWRLSAFDRSGTATFVPNPKYSGPVRPTLSKFIELPYTTDSAQFKALVGGKINVGYLPLTDVTQPTSNPLVAGPNNPRLSNFTLDPLYTWSINYFPENYDSTGISGAAGAIFKQLYFRQAFQTLVDQPLYIQKIDKGYAVGTYGPVPVTPSNPYASAFEKSNPYPYDVQKAVTLLKSHGWNVVPNGTSTCIKPGTASDQCGAGIPAGTGLTIQLQYASGNASIDQLMNAEKSSWAQAGINVQLSTGSFNTVIGNATPCPSGCSWQMENWGAGWFFAPDYYPSGEEIFQTGAGSNWGNYSDATNDANITATNKTSVDLTTYENNLAKQLPVVYQPNAVTEMTEIQNNLRGVTPQNVFWAITPENWYYVH